ncbi:hypothetical protein [Massilia genomosp. 1]|uniref:Methyl-accepting transducer domain-containing protein n=1 Tax=Massilia genomosp. 1 TaxID=2609280 RepID=A0ABX0MS77_9BURK|nr:hypothetical protein [Massilia genomosp. 1]NHZ63216.1 hypothetical protein [Massilia genomosp. 1]
MNPGALLLKITAIGERFTETHVVPLDGLEARVDLCVQGFDALADTLDASLLALDTCIDTSATALENDLDDLSGNIELHASRLAESVGALATLSTQNRSASHDALANLGNAAGTVTAALAVTESASAADATTITDRFSAWAALSDAGADDNQRLSEAVQAAVKRAGEARAAEFAKLQSLCDDVARKVETICSALAKEWTQEIHTLAQGAESLLLSQIRDAVKVDIGGVTDTLDALRRSAEQLSGAIGEDAMRLVDSLSRIIELLDAIKPLIEIMRQLD